MFPDRDPVGALPSQPSHCGTRVPSGSSRPLARLGRLGADAILTGGDSHDARRAPGVVGSFPLHQVLGRLHVATVRGQPPAGTFLMLGDRTSLAGARKIVGRREPFGPGECTRRAALAFQAGTIANNLEAEAVRGAPIVFRLTARLAA